MRPLFLFSLPRSGSTLVQRVLGAHPQIATTAEPWVLLPVLFGTRADGARATYWHQTGAEALGDFIAGLDDGLDAWREEVREFALRLYRRAGGEGHAYFLDKTPRYHAIASELMEVFPDGRFVFLWRNPLAVLASALDTFRAGRFEPYHFGVDLYGGVAHLVDAHRRADERAFAVRYEDLVSGDDAPWRALLTHLGLDHEPGLLERLPAERPRGRYGDPTGVARYDAIASDSVDRWQQTLHGPVRAAWARRYLAWIGEDRLAEMGYDLAALRGGLPLTGVPSARDGAHLLASRWAAQRRAAALARPEGPRPLGPAFAE